MKSLRTPIDPKLDLVIERTVDIPPELVWEAWTKPEHIKAWFVPPPWSVVECEIDLKPGGKFRTVMQGPDGERMDGGAGCYLEIIENRRLVWTDALGPGFRPAGTPFFTAVISMEPAGAGTEYTAVAMHGTESDRNKHEEMNFQEGWSTVLDQLVAHMKSHVNG